MDSAEIHAPALSVSQITYSNTQTESSCPWNLFATLVLLSAFLLFQTELNGPDWVLLSRNRKILEDPVLYRPFDWSQDPPVLWTDDYSNLLTVLKRWCRELVVRPTRGDSGCYQHLI